MVAFPDTVRATSVLRYLADAMVNRIGKRVGVLLTERNVKYSRRRRPRSRERENRNIMSHCGGTFHMLSIPGRDVHPTPQFATLNMLYTIMNVIRSWRKLVGCHHAKVFKNYVFPLRRGCNEQSMVYVRPPGIVIMGGVYYRLQFQSRQAQLQSNRDNL